MEIITSVKNQYVKLARSLAEKKFRDEEGLFLVEGGNLIKDMPSSVAIEFVLTTEERALEAEELVASSRARVYYVSDSLMKSISDTVTPYGLVAVVRKPEQKFEMPGGNALVLDGVSDPGNLGTIIRTAAAADFLTVYLCDCADIYSPKVVRATLGGIFKVDCCIVGEKEALDVIRKTESIALDMGGDDINKSQICAPVTFVSGSEAHGIRDVFKRNAKQIKSLTMRNGIESLNVAVATAVAMYSVH